MKTIGFDLTCVSSSKIVGSDKYIQRLIKQMMTRELGFKCVFYIQKQVDPKVFGINEKNKDVLVIKVPTLTNPIKRILFQQTLFYFYLKKMDLMYSNGTYLPLFANCKKIITLHDLLPFAFKKKHSLLRRLFIVEFTKIISKRVCHVITVSENSKKDILKYLKKKEEDISIVYNFINPDEEVIRGKECVNNIISTTEGDMPLNKPYICTVSSLQPGKNLANLIKAFIKFHNAYPKYTLYICGGKGWGYQELFDIVKDNKAQDYIKFTGYVSDAVLDTIYSDCEAVAYVSYFEGFGIPPLEGFHHGKPCVASNTTSLPEVVGKAGVLVDPYDVDSISNGLNQVISNKICIKEINNQRDKFNFAIETNKFIRIMNKFS